MKIEAQTGARHHTQWFELIMNAIEHGNLRWLVCSAISANH